MRTRERLERRDLGIEPPDPGEPVGDELRGPTTTAAGRADQGPQDVVVHPVDERVPTRFVEGYAERVVPAVAADRTGTDERRLFAGRARRVGDPFGPAQLRQDVRLRR